MRSKRYNTATLRVHAALLLAATLIGIAGTISIAFAADTPPDQGPVIDWEASGCPEGDFTCLYKKATDATIDDSTDSTTGPGYTEPGLYATDEQTINPYDKPTPYVAIPERPSEALTKETSLETFLIRLVNWVAMFLGLAGFVILIYAGFIMVTSLDNEENMTKAKNMITQVIIGVIIVLASYAIIFTIIGGRGRLFFY